MKFKSNVLIGSFLALGLIFTSCNNDDDDSQSPKPDPNLTDLVANASQFSILEEALIRTELDVVLSSSTDQYTVFAPNDVAFNALFNELGVSNLDEAIAAVGANGIKNILLYHVVSGKVMASDLTQGYVETEGVNGNNFNLSAYVNLSSGVEINDRSSVISSDLTATNGVAHEIDNVLLPLSINDIVTVDPNLSSAQTAINLADGNLDDLLNDEGQTFTLFAPTNTAFDTLVANEGAADLADLVASIGTDVLADVLLYHVLGSEQRAADLTTGNVETAFYPNGQGSTAATFFVNVGSSSVTIIDNNNTSGDANVTMTDLTAINGTVHVINQVLLPQ